MLLEVAVIVFMETPEGEQLREQTQTLVVNAHGGLLKLNMDVLAGQPMLLVNMKTEQEESCRVVRAEVVPGGQTAVAFEFDRPAPQFWPVVFPPADWNLVPTSEKSR